RMRRLPWRVEEVRGGRDDSWTLRLLPRGHDGMDFRPGQFAWLSLGDSPWTMQQHPFSMTSSADEEGAVEFTIKALGDFTSTIQDVEAGSRAWLEGPYGVFTWKPGQCPEGAVFITGGVGITPVMSMLRTARDRGPPQRPAPRGTAGPGARAAVDGDARAGRAAGRLGGRVGQGGRGHAAPLAAQGHCPPALLPVRPPGDGRRPGPGAVADGR